MWWTQTPLGRLTHRGLAYEMQWPKAFEKGRPQCEGKSPFDTRCRARIMLWRRRGAEARGRLKIVSRGC